MKRSDRFTGAATYRCMCCLPQSRKGHMLRSLSAHAGRVGPHSAAPTMADWKYLAGSIVMYDAADPVSAFFCVSSTWDYLALFAFGFAVLFTANRRWAAVLSGTLVATALCEAIKRLLKQPRPSPTWAAAGEHVGYGMPSQHANTGFAAATLFCLIIARKRRFPQRAAIGFALAGIQAVGRVYNEYHTVEQVIAGSALGCAIGFVLAATAVGRGILERLASVTLWCIGLLHCVV